jgi:hypothetical protein
MKRALVLPGLTSLCLLACDPAPAVAPPPAMATPPAATPAAPAPAAAAKLDRVPRADWNRIAAERNLPLFWVADANRSGAIDPDELTVLWGIAPEGGPWTQDGKLTPAFLSAYEAIAKIQAEGYKDEGLTEAEKKRRALVREELAQGRQSVIVSDFRGASEEDRAIVEHVLKAAGLVERIHARQLGSFGMDAEIPADDTASKTLFFRNQGPFCEAPKTEGNADCNALARKPAKVSGLYPASLQKDPKFCEALEARKDQKELLYQFAVVTENKEGGLAAVPYNEAYKDDMRAVSRELKAAAEAIKSPGEAAFKAYLLAAAQAFLDNEWEPADEAWAKMSVDNSKWYLRIAPDEVYYEPCSRKAGFHVSFARINQDSLEWQKKLDPVKADMEGALAKLAGAPYKARKVTFHLPDFIDIVVNAGDSRDSRGGTIGQSLPNWGPVANEGRGRTVAMTNLYTDKDSEIAFRGQVESLLCKDSVGLVVFEPKYAVMSTVLHEAAHNLGPAHEYKVKGKTDDEIFGGPLASTLEELKAQTAALYFAEWLVGKGLIDRKTAELAHARDVAWAFGHIAQGMYNASGKPKPYSQLASIQMGHLVAEKALEWRATETAANGKDQGCFALHMEKFEPAIGSLAKKVLGIKGGGDKAAAVKLRDEHVDKDGDWKKLRGVIEERWLRAPKASFVYSIKR